MPKFLSGHNMYLFKKKMLNIQNQLFQSVAVPTETSPLVEHANLALPCKPCLCGIFHSLALSESKYCGCVSTFIKPP